MLANKALVLLASLATTSNALYFHLTSFHTSDIRIPSPSHALAFTISNPDANSEGGGSAAANCTLTWTTPTRPPCWTSCGANSGWGYYARIPSYSGAENFTLEIQEYFAYRNSVLNNLSIPVVESGSVTADYGCSRGGQSTQCNFRDGDSCFDTSFGTYYGFEKSGPLC